MAAIANSLVFASDTRFQALSGCALKASENSLVICRPMNLSLTSLRPRKTGAAICKSQFVPRAVYREGGRQSSPNIFIGGFVLGGIMIGTLACLYASQISKALTGTNKKDLLRKLPKFIYDEEKAMEKARKALEEKIAEIDSALDEVYAQIQAKDEDS